MSSLPIWAYLIPPLAFVLGVVAGRYYERHKETIAVRDIAAAYKSWYARWDAVVVTLVAVTALVGIWIGASATVTNGQQDRRADARDSAVQKCFDRYAAAQSASSKAVREASVVKDEATRIFNQALNDEGRAFLRWTKTLSDGLADPTSFDRARFIAANERLRETLEVRASAGRAVERAQAELDKAREENPVPSAPSTFCSVQP